MVLRTADVVSTHQNINPPRFDGGRGDALRTFFASAALTNGIGTAYVLSTGPSADLTGANLGYTL